MPLLDAIGPARRTNAVFLAAAFAVLVYALYPGAFDADGWYMFSLSGDLDNINDAHSPLLAVLIAATREFIPGPAILFVLQLAAWFTGLFLLTDALIRSGRANVGRIISVACALPLISFIFLDVNKDTGLAAVGMVFAAILVRAGLGGRRFTALGLLGVFLLGVLFMDIRVNAFIAAAPLVAALAYCWWPPSTRATWLRWAAVSLGALLALFAADQWVKYDLIKADRMWGARQLAIFDIAGITWISHDDVSGGLFGRDFRPDARACYTPKWHDPFEWGECRADGAKLAELSSTEEGRTAIFGAWRRAALSHPVSYIRHRIAFYNQLTEGWCADCSVPMTTGLEERPWPHGVTRVTPPAVMLERVAFAMYADWLVGRGVMWLLALFACLGLLAAPLRRRRPTPLEAAALGVCLSATLYALAYFWIGIAFPSRYLHWTVMMGVVSICLTGSILAERRAQRRALGADGVEWITPLPKTAGRSDAAE